MRRHHSTTKTENREILQHLEAAAHLFQPVAARGGSSINRPGMHRPLAIRPARQEANRPVST